MSTEQNKIYFGYFPDFANPTMLFFGSPTAFASFEDVFRDLLHKDGGVVRLSESPLFAPGNADIVIRILPQATGIQKIKDDSFDWGLSIKECQLFANELHDFAQAQPGAAFHQYLDCNALDDVEVKASVGEYSVEFFKGHGDNMWEDK